MALRTALNLLSGKDVAKRQVIEPKLITVENYKTYVRPELPDGVFVDTSLSEEELKQLFKA